jgi:AcrR family transcriptional regulator
MHDQANFKERYQVRNQLQQERMRQYFVAAAITILKNEGPAGISARNVAKQAGYSYATLYNYFEDIYDLAFECQKQFCIECSFYVRNESQNSEPGVERIKSVCRAYAKYFLQNPGIFNLFFTYKDTKSSGSHEYIANKLLSELTAQDFKILNENEIIDKEQTKRIETQLLVALTGMLLLFLNRGFPESFSEFVAQLDQALENLLRI